MASLPCGDRPLRSLDCKVFHYLLVPVVPAATLSAHQVDVSISFQLDIMCHYCSSDFTQLHHRMQFTPQTLRFDLDVFKDPEKASQLLGSLLTSLAQLSDDSPLFSSVIDNIRQRGLQIIAGSITSDMAPVTVHLSVQLAGKVLEHVMLKKVRMKDGGCAICLEELEGASDTSQMPCSHAFHTACIETWLKQSHCCPVCRFECPTSRI